MPDPTLTACHLGPTSYRAGLALQEALVRARAAGETGDWLLYPDHPPVLTVGRGGSDASLRVDREALARLGIEVFEVARGGDYTFHGPGQLVGYLVCDLAARGRDLHAFLRAIEDGLVEALAGFGIVGGTVKGRTGVWVAGEREGEMQKIASIGVAVRRWVSYHGFALNVAPDLRYFDLIHPCGLRDARMTSLAARRAAGGAGSGGAPAMSEVRARVTAAMARRLGLGAALEVPAAAAWEHVGNAQGASAA